MSFLKTKHADLVRKLCCLALGFITFGCFGARDPAPDVPWLKDLPEAMRKEGIFFHHLYQGELSLSGQQTLIGRHFIMGQDAKFVSNIPINHEWWYLSVMDEVRKLTRADENFYFGIPAGAEEASFDEFWTESDIKFLQRSHPLLKDFTSTSKDGWDYAIWRQRIYDVADIYHNVGELTFYRIGGRWFSEKSGKDSSRPNKGSTNGLIKVASLLRLLPKDIEQSRAFVSKLYNEASIVRSFKDQSIFFSTSKNEGIVLPGDEEFSPWPEFAKKVFTKNFSKSLADKGDLASVGEQIIAPLMREVPMSKDALAPGTYRQFAPSLRQITFQEIAYISLRIIPSHRDYFAYEFNFSGKVFRFKVAVDEYETFEIKLFEFPPPFKGFGVLEIGDLGHSLIIDMKKAKESKRKKSPE
jgi:hypothetical protein